MSTIAMAVVMGDVDMVRALGLAGIQSSYFGPPDYSARFSRHVRAVLPWLDEWRCQEQNVTALLRFARAQPEPPVLYPQTDAAVLLTSRYRDELRRAFRFILADAELIEQLVDKARFQLLAERYGLPVPPAQRLRPSLERAAPDLEVPFPVIVKPVQRGGDWTATGELGKALRVRTQDDWYAVWPRLASLRSELLVQRLVPRPESAIESFHAYINAGGNLAGEFTGPKIRTFPPHYGYSSAVEIVDLPDVADLGRHVLATLDMRGVAKVDFKRDDRRRLHLLEINPRFNLWHHPAAVAGVNLPALVHSDLSGCPCPPGRRPTRHVTWCAPLLDVRAAYMDGMSLRVWLRWASRREAVLGLSWDDPLPFLRGTLWGAIRRRLPRPARVRRRIGARDAAESGRKRRRGSDPGRATHDRGRGREYARVSLVRSPWVSWRPGIRGAWSGS